MVGNLNLQNDFDRLVKQNNWWNKNSSVVIGVSTGVDSMTLLWLLEHLKSNRPKIIVAYVNHHLRKASEKETSFIKDYCTSHSLTLETADWQVKDHPRYGIEEAGRKFRYRFFEKCMDRYNSTTLLTAHHGDDLAETFLMKLIRGGQLDSLIGIYQVRPFHHGQLVRPLLGFSKQQIREFATNKKLKWYEDETNKDLNVQRNRIRHLVLPLLKKENSELLSHVFNYSKQIQENNYALESLLDPLVNQALRVSHEVIHIDLGVVKRTNAYIQRSLIRYILEKKMAIHNISQNGFEEIMNIINGNNPHAQIHLQNNWVIWREYSSLNIGIDDIETTGKTNKYNNFMVILNQRFHLNDVVDFGVFEADKVPEIHVSKVPIVLKDSDFPLLVRPVKLGDKVTLKNGGHKKVARILIDKKIPVSQRKSVKVLVASSGKLISVLRIWNSTAQKKLAGEKYYLVQINQKERKGNSDE